MTAGAEARGQRRRIVLKFGSGVLTHANTVRLALEELTSYKYVIRGNGQIRN